MENLLSPDDVARMLGVKTKTVSDWLRAGRLRGHKAGRLWRVYRQDVERFLKPNDEPARDSMAAMK